MTLTVADNIFRKPPYCVESVSFSPDGKRILAGTQRGEIRLWDAETAEETLTIPAHSQDVSDMTFTDKGRRIISASLHNTIKIRDAGTNEFIRPLIASSVCV